MREGIESPATLAQEVARGGRSRLGIGRREFLAQAAFLFAASRGLTRLHAEDPPEEDPLSVSQRIITVEEFSEARVVIEKLTRELIPKMNDDKYMVRQRATEDAGALIIDLARTVNPLPREVDAALMPRRGDVTLEQYYRVKGLRSGVEEDARIGTGPTRVPIRKGVSAEEVLSLLSAHSGMTIRVADHDADRLRSLQLKQECNSFGKIVRAVSEHTGMIPRIAQGEHFVLEFVPRESEDQQVCLDTSGMVLGVYAPKKATIDLIADPQRAFIEISEGTVSGIDSLEVRLQPTMTPLWRSLKDMDQPTLSMRTQRGKSSRFDQPEMTVLLGMQSRPKTVDVPLTGNRPIEFGALQSMRVTEGADTGGIVGVTMFHHEDAHPSSFWTEMRACTPQFCLLDDRAQSLQTQALSLSYVQGVAGGSTFSTELRSERLPAALRIRAYAEQDPYYSSYGYTFGDEDRRTEIRFLLPRKE